MSLHDIDKSSNGRTNPMPNAKDININRMAHGTTGFTLKEEDGDQNLGKLILKDGRLILQTNQNTFVDLSNGNIEVKRETGDTFSRMGYRPDDAKGAIDVARPGEAV